MPYLTFSSATLGWSWEKLELGVVGGNNMESMMLEFWKRHAGRSIGFASLLGSTLA